MFTIGDLTFGIVIRNDSNYVEPAGKDGAARGSNVSASPAVVKLSNMWCYFQGGDRGVGEVARQCVPLRV